MGSSNLKPPASTSPTSSSSHSSANSNSAPAPPLPPVSSKIPPRPSVIVHENPNPTTFIQADPSSFKHVVQMLTGHAVSSSAAAPLVRKPSTTNTPARSNLPTFKKSSSFGLYQRRRSSQTLHKLKLSDPAASVASGDSSPASPLVPISPSSFLDITTLSLSPVTPLTPDPFVSPAAAEEKAIAEKGFYLHPSPRGTESTEQPLLLSLFPVTSPRVSSPSPA